MDHRYIEASDGTPIAFRVRGQGLPLLLVNGFCSSDFYWEPLVPRLQPRCQLISWDLKGHGASGAARSADSVTVEGLVDDLRRVLDATGVKRAVLVGFSMGCQIVLEAYRQLPQRVAGMVTILGTYGRPFDHFLHPRLGPLLHRALQHLPPQAAGPLLKLTARGAALPGAFWLNQRLHIVGRLLRREDMEPFFDHLRVIHGPTWVQMGRAAQQHSAREVLPDVKVPTLVIAGGHDAFTPVQLGRDMARHIPGAELFELPDATHTGLLEFPQLIGDRLLRFFEQHQLYDTD